MKVRGMAEEASGDQVGGRKAAELQRQNSALLGSRSRLQAAWAGIDMNHDPLLAGSWRASTVEACLSDRACKDDLICFLRARYQERFFEPIQALRNAGGNQQGFGFSMMALCCLLIETIQCYRAGLPSTNRGELERLAQRNAGPANAYSIDPNEWKDARTVFEEFFRDAATKGLFASIDGTDFYKNVRNGLLHQGQTKDGWKINVGQNQLFDANSKRLDRNLFVEDLRNCFDRYLKELEEADWDEVLWKNLRRKVWWLVELSK